MDKVFACIDEAPDSASVCAHAAWAAQRLDAPLALLHVLDLPVVIEPPNEFGGLLGADVQQDLLNQMATLDAQRARLAREHGQLLLEAAARQAEQAGLKPWDVRQRHGALVDTLVELEAQARLFVLGPGRHHRERSPAGRLHLDHQLERVLRAVQRPVLVAARGFRAPEGFLIAFDGSATGRTMVELVAGSPLLRGLPAHLLMVAEGNGGAARLEWAHDRLAQAGFRVESALVPGEPETAIPAQLQQHGLGLLVMGAYGHSRIRQLILGSTTTTVLRTSPVPVLVLR